MKRAVTLSLLLALGGFSAWAQSGGDLKTVEETTQKTKEQNAEAVEEPTWTKGGLVSLNFNQVSLVNWAAGGQSSVAANAFVNVFANYRKGKSSWDNNLDLGYGLLKQGTDPFIKSDDRIDFTSKYGQQAFDNDKWFYTVLLNFKSQFAPGYSDPITQDDLISDFLSPGYLLGAIGMDYKRNDNLSLFISPITGKMTMVMNDSLADAGAFGVEPAMFTDGVKTADGKNIRMELGGYFKMQYQRNLMENMDFKTRVELFSNYLENPGNIDVFWETLFDLKINKYITANVGFTLIYDDDINVAVLDGEGNTIKEAPRTQFKQVLGVGFGYKF